MESLRAKIIGQLDQDRRWVLAENSVLLLLFAVGGLILTGILWWGIRIVLFVLIRDFNSWQLHGITLLIVSGILYAGRKTLNAPEFNPRDINLFKQGGWRESEETVQEVLAELAVVGPRCFVLAARCAVFLRRVMKADLDRLAAVIEVALKQHGKVVERDLTGVNMGAFLREAQWIAGVLPLFRAPAGFILTEEFRAHFPGLKRERPRAEERQESRKERRREKARPRYDIDESVEDEIRWALLLLGLNEKATRKEIVLAYRNLAKLVHPDLGPPHERADRENRMKDLNLAYEILRRRR